MLPSVEARQRDSRWHQEGRHPRDMGASTSRCAHQGQGGSRHQPASILALLSWVSGEYQAPRPTGLRVWPRQCKQTAVSPARPRAIAGQVLLTFGLILPSWGTERPCKNRRFELSAQRALEISPAVEVNSLCRRAGRMFAMSFRKGTKSLLM